MKVAGHQLTRRGDALVLAAAIASGVIIGAGWNTTLNTYVAHPVLLQPEKAPARATQPTSAPQPATPTHTSHPTPKPTVKRTPSPSRSYARQQVGAQQYRCLDVLWSRESHWNPKAKNPRSTAAGIPQLLGLDTRLPAHRQVDAGLKYITHRYGTACNALHHSNRWGWY